MTPCGIKSKKSAKTFQNSTDGHDFRELVQKGTSASSYIFRLS